MSLCDHCEGQRFDRSRVLRALRAARKALKEQRRPCSADEALATAISAVREMDIPHLERLEDMAEGELVH